MRLTSLLLITMCILSSSISSAQTSSKRIRVAILPVQHTAKHTLQPQPGRSRGLPTNESTPEWEALRGKQIAASESYLIEEFNRRDFAVIDRRSVISTVKEMGVDLSRAENHSSDVLTAISRKLDAAMICVTFIMATSKGSIGLPIAGKQREPFSSTAKTILFNNGKTIVDGQVGTANVFAGCMDQGEQVQSAVSAIAQTLDEFLKNYPVRKRGVAQYVYGNR